MSNRNSQANKQAARERLRAERERQAKRDKIRRQMTVAGGILVVLAVAGGIGFAISNSTGGSKNVKVSDKKWRAAAAKTTFAEPAHTTGEQGLGIVIGDKDAKNTLGVFEDPRCPACASFEQNTGETVLKDIKDGKYKAQFALGTFLDDSFGGSGSKNALSALGAALNVSTDAFLDYKKTLYAAKNHPDERDDQFSDDEKLIRIAQQVKELKGNKGFEADVRKGTYDKWALAMSDYFNKQKIKGTPTIRLNGKNLTVDGRYAPMSPQQFTPLVDEGLKKK
ncbi:thioredoxin domain-containing protein [Streptomyces sp. B1866]|uniref:thioredoxin domain-containing protein n=1 Tax=Streptomyces sp. B1866 TaxID=3075431 RepID=UPI00289015AD|nr:thioredoxin domain-containing protein [Streptomyces sp. B1866]MDT3398773.1 thioredoxin domain-containing protein [Streptomyces sp. B1866]